MEVVLQTIQSSRLNKNAHNFFNIKNDLNHHQNLIIFATANIS